MGKVKVTEDLSRFYLDSNVYVDVEIVERSGVKQLLLRAYPGGLIIEPEVANVVLVRSRGWDE